jgi:MFS family permease
MVVRRDWRWADRADARPPLGGFITAYATWHWIFLINLPIGLVGIFLVTRYVENVRATRSSRSISSA